MFSDDILEGGSDLVVELDFTGAKTRVDGAITEGIGKEVLGFPGVDELLDIGANEG